MLTQTLREPLKILTEWSVRHVAEVIAAREEYNAHADRVKLTSLQIREAKADFQLTLHDHDSRGPRGPRSMFRSSGSRPNSSRSSLIRSSSLISV